MSTSGRRFVSFMVVLFSLALLFNSLSVAQQKTVSILPGTKVQKLGPGHFKFTLPDRQVVEVKNLNLTAGTTGSISIINPDPPSKPVVSGSNATILGIKKITKTEAAKLPPTSVIQIDDDVTWLPLTISFTPKASVQLNPQPEPPAPPVSPRLNPQPEPPMPSNPVKK